MAVVLGGSRARGTHTDSSDHDFGLYYRGSFDVDALAREVRELGEVTPIGGWGTWINGGGWLTFEGRRVDLLYRDLDRVAAVIDDCHRGVVTMHYQPGHPHGFLSSTYMSEIALCRPLFDRDGAVELLRERTVTYPDALRGAIVRTFAWQVDFHAQLAAKGVARGDVAYVRGCLFQGLMALLQTLFANHGEYWMNEKGAVAIAERWLPGLGVRVEEMFAAEPGEAVLLYQATCTLAGAR